MRESPWVFVGLCCVAVVYALYVATVVVPHTNREMEALLSAAQRVAEDRWLRTKHWMESAGSKVAETRMQDMSVGMNATSDVVQQLRTHVHELLLNANTAKKAVEAHVRDFHGFGDVAHGKVCFALGEPWNAVHVSGSDDGSPLLSSLQQASGLHTGKTVHLGIVAPFPRSVTDDAFELRLALQKWAVAANVKVHAPRDCGLAESEWERLKCSADACYAAGYDYVIPVTHAWTLSGTAWPPTLVKVFRKRDDLCVAKFGVVDGQKVKGAAVAFSAFHFRVFGTYLTQSPNQTAVGDVSQADLLLSLSSWSKRVYGDEFSCPVPAASLVVVVKSKNNSTKSGEDGTSGTSSTIAASSATATPSVVVEEPPNRLSFDLNSDMQAWHRYLCRVKLWARYCTHDDVAEFLRRPHGHENSSLSRADLEEMERAAKGGYAADMKRILQAQHAAHASVLARRKDQETAHQAHVVALRSLLSSVGGVVDWDEDVASYSDKDLKRAVVSLLRKWSSRRPTWAQLWNASTDELISEAKTVFPSHAEENKLRASIQAALDGTAVLPEEEKEFAAFATVLQKNPKFALDGPKKGHDHDHQEDDDSVRIQSCVIDGVTVPWPWFARYQEGYISFDCFANKSDAPAEKCCDYKDTASPTCVAHFQSYDAKSVLAWMEVCKTPTWKPISTVRVAPSVSDLPAAYLVDKSAVLASSVVGADGTGVLGQEPCEHAGVVVPSPWYRLPSTPKNHCIAPKDVGRMEKCCSCPLCAEAFAFNLCVARFEGYKAVDMESWKKSCRMPHWGKENGGVMMK